MNLPDDSIGITDILAYRDCPRRFSYGMRRHVGRAAQSDDRTPESGSHATAYGSAIHDALQAVEDGHTDEEAMQRAWNAWGALLEPSDVQLLRDDVEKYRQRDFPQTRTIAAEDEYRVPLFRHEGRQIYFRFKLDRLYERIDAPGTFIHVDFKSSRWARSQSEVDEDLQMWSYNFGIHEYFPECDRLLQTYDQLRYGQLSTRKSDEQRKQIHDWLIVQVKAILADEGVQDDGLLRPTLNRWCPWCPIMESCPVVGELTEFAKTRIAALAPQHKEGRSVVVDVDPERAAEYANELEDVKLAQKVLKRFEEAVTGLIRELPDERRQRSGYELRQRGATSFGPQEKAELYEGLGHERFVDAAKITKTGLAATLVDEPDLRDWALEVGDQVEGQPVVARSG